MICNGRKENGSKNLENGFNEGSKKDGSSKNENDSNNDLNSNLKIDNLKIIYPKLIKKNQNDLNHSLMKIIYKSGEFNLTNKNRKEIGNLIYEKCVEEWKERKNGNDDKEGNDSKDEGSEKEGNTPNNLDSNGNEENDTNPNNPNSNQGLNYKVKDFNLNDPVIQNLIKHDFEKIQKGLKSVDLKFILNLLQKKEIESFEDSFNSEIHYLLFLFFTKKYDNLVKDLPPSQWKIIISILLFSDHPLENCLESFKKIKIEKDEDDEKEGDKQILFLLTNNPKEILKTNLIKSEPKSIFEINEFFSEYVPIVEKIKALKIETEDKFLKEFVKYAKDHGIYELLKDLEENEDGNNDVNVNVNKSVENINQDLRNINLNQNIRNVGYSPQPPQNVGYPPKKPGYPQPNQNIISPQNIINPQPNPQNQPNVSHPSKTYSKPPIPKQPHQNYPNQVNPIPSPIERQRGPTIPRVVPSLRQNFKPPTRPDIGSQNIPTPSSGFCTRPPVKSPLYSCPSSGSTPNIPNVNNPNIHNTYGSENNSYLKPKTPPLPNQGIKGIIPKPSLHPKPQPNYNPNPLVVQSNSFYDKIGLSTDLEKIYENLREEASKKNNLIIGNKIKDANRRFSVFLNLDKTSLTNNVLYKMNLLVQTFKDVNDKKLLRQSVKVIIEESIDIQENQCNIWMPSIFTLVQLVY